MKKVLLVVSILILVSAWPAAKLYSEWSKFDNDDPIAWEEDIVAFELEDAKGHNPESPVVFVGSSSIRFWGSLIEDMSPIPVVQRGFGGAKLNDVVHYADRLVSVHKPSAVVIFAGTNDILPGNSKSPEVLLASYQQFVENVRLGQNDLPIYYIAITPSASRWEAWSIAQATNKLVADYSAQDDSLYVIDTSEALMDSNGMPDSKFYKFDKLHLSDEGYEVWTRLIKPLLLPYVH